MYADMHIHTQCTPARFYANIFSVKSGNGRAMKEGKSQTWVGEGGGGLSVKCNEDISIKTFTKRLI